MTIASIYVAFSVSNRYLNSNWNSIFFYPIRVASTLSGLLVINLFPFHLYIQFDAAHNQSVVTSNVDMVDDCYVWPGLFVRI